MSSTAATLNLLNSKTREEIIPSERLVFTAPQPLGDGEMTFSMAPLWRDPTTQANSMLVKLTKGADPRHKHPHDFYLIVMEGQLIHISEGITGSENVTLGPGSYYFQPANVVHQDICITDKALVFCALLGDGGTNYV